jgi:hypothetical protein
MVIDSLAVREGQAVRAHFGAEVELFVDGGVKAI